MLLNEGQCLTHLLEYRQLWLIYLYSVIVSIEMTSVVMRVNFNFSELNGNFFQLVDNIQEQGHVTSWSIRRNVTKNDINECF